ncbi:carboxypeptidase-like regulatory domain-containing protein [Joostella sp.]|uniref:carboxypeptidase-like regulatory domain-containing protein n=1 Tax=Joostella sp. TaxID=2231138 RepID=UPI003A8F8974
MKHIYLSFFFCLIALHNLFSQEAITAKVVDAKTQEPIPFVTISYNDKNGVISSDTGDFTLYIDEVVSETDSLFISCLGYNEVRYGANDFSDKIIQLETKEIELDEIVLLNKNYSVEEILDRVKDSLEMNYDTDYVEQKVFFRTSDYTNVQNKSVKIKESSIPEINQQFTDSLIMAVPSKSSYHTEILGDLYVKMEEDNQTSKLAILKASELYDKNNQLSFKGVEEKLQNIMRKHVKRDSYFKIKSGLIGAKSDIDSSVFADKELDTLMEAKLKKEKERKENFLKYRSSYMNIILKRNFIYEDSDLNFIHKSRKYDFVLEELLYLKDDLVYKISFVPDGGADFKGMMYVNADDYAIVRLDYENIKPLKNINLFGVSYKDYLLKGTFLYTKNDRGKYSLKYLEENSGEIVGFDRPVTIIEKNKNVKGRRKQNEIATDVDFTLQNSVKVELVVFECNPVDKQQFEEFTPEPTVIPTYLPDYDSSFWEGYNIIAPNEAIKEFKSID